MTEDNYLGVLKDPKNISVRVFWSDHTLVMTELSNRNVMPVPHSDSINMIEKVVYSSLLKQLLIILMDLSSYDNNPLPCT